MILALEGHCDRPNATIEDVYEAVAALGRTDGPLHWRDVTPELVEDAKQHHDDDGEIGLISPR
jgi:hypothetical protein